MTAEERFWSKVDTSGECWLWTAGTRRHGYGSFHLDGRNRPAHRVAWMFANGRPPAAGMVIDHICRNKACVRPGHLREVTQRVNVLSGPTIIAAQVAKVECLRGHPLSGANLHIDSRGYRVCRACGRLRWHKGKQHAIAREGGQQS